MVQKDVIMKKLKELDRYLQQLVIYQGVTAVELEKNLEKQWILERGLQLCIQVVLDIGNHVLAEEGVAVNSYKDIVVELGNRNVIPPSFAQKIQGMAGLRNIIIHEYAVVDLSLLAAIINERLDDFKKFAGYIIDSID
ncbi:MAG: DUF86 domain-containing protein [Bacillota bacterium]